MAITKVTTSGFADCSVSAAKVEDGQLASADIAPGSLSAAKLAGSIANAKLSNSSITINGSAVSLGGDAGGLNPIDWQAVVVSDGSTVTTMVAGRGYFVNNTSAAGIVKLPASASAGDTIKIKDYAGNFGTNNLIIQRNSHKIQGEANDSKLDTNKASVTLIYVNATKGWLFVNESNVGLLNTPFIEATGGTVTTTGNFKVHTFTGDGNFIVSNAGLPAGSTKVDYLVIAGGGGGGAGSNSTNIGTGAGGGAGGHRTTFPSPGCNAGAFPISVQTYPITIGSGGAGSTFDRGGSGSNSVFSTITSAGGGGGGGNDTPNGIAGGSGGGGSKSGSGGGGNTPPVSPSQGNSGGNGGPSSASGGGGIGSSGSPAPGSSGGNGGNGTANSITGSSVTRAGGGGGRGDNGTGGSGGSGGGGAAGTGGPDGGDAGTANTGGGGGGGAFTPGAGAGGSGVVIIRYKYQ